MRTTYHTLYRPLNIAYFSTNHRSYMYGLFSFTDYGIVDLG